MALPRVAVYTRISDDDEGKRLGVNLKIAHQQISARLMSEAEAELLDVETPAACLSVDRLAYDDVGQFVEFGRHMYHAAHYSIQSSLVA